MFNKQQFNAIKRLQKLSGTILCPLKIKAKIVEGANN